MEGLSPHHFQLYEIPEIDNYHQRNMVGFLLPVLNYPLNFIPPALSLENHEQVTHVLSMGYVYFNHKNNRHLICLNRVYSLITK